MVLGGPWPGLTWKYWNESCPDVVLCDITRRWGVVRRGCVALDGPDT